MRPAAAAAVSVLLAPRRGAASCLVTARCASSSAAYPSLAAAYRSFASVPGKLESVVSPLCRNATYFLSELWTNDEAVRDSLGIHKAWQLCDPDAKYVFEALKRAGVRTAVVSNFDTRPRPLLQALKCDHWFDAVAISAEVAAEKPNPTIFLKACELLGVKPEEAVHIGDDRRNDLWGVRDAGKPLHLFPRSQKGLELT